MKISFENFRVFHKVTSVDIKPVTILVGENSSGKSSFLAGSKFLLEAILSGEGNFNQEPFFLGAYDQLAHYRGGRFGRAPSFKMRLEFEPDEVIKDDFLSRRFRVRRERAEFETPTRIELTFENERSQPALSVVRLSGANVGVEIQSKESPCFRIIQAGTERVIKFEAERREIAQSTRTNRNNVHRFVGPIADWVFRTLDTKRKDNTEDHRLASQIFGLLQWIFQSFSEPSVYASAPFRTRPERTYSPVEAVSSSEGTHVPILLAQLKSFESREWMGVKERLIEFGKQSDLFRGIDVKRLGRSNSDPFQLMITVSKVRSNIIDVGYGISQVLPIIVELLVNDSPGVFMFQQPEVHLHPKGQAELGSFFLKQAARRRRRSFWRRTAII